MEELTPYQAKTEQLMKTSSIQSKKILVQSKPIPNETDGQISVYSGTLTLLTVVEQNLRIKKAFPSLPKEWFDIFQNRIIENKFTDQRLIDAVNYVIDNCQYPTPTIAQFISYDKKIPLKTYSQLLQMLNEDKQVFSHYKPVVIDGVDKVMWAKVEDVKKYNLKVAEDNQSEKTKQKKGGNYEQNKTY